MKKKLIDTIICVLAIAMCCFGFVACGDDESESSYAPSRDDTKWFTETELEEKGLSGLTAPTGLTGEMSTSVTWFGNGYYFRQPCPSVEVFEANAQTYFDYFKTRYDGLFGTDSIEKLNLEENETWYVLTQKENLSDYFNDNPSKLYEFYFVTDATLEDGYFKTDAVWTFEIRYEYDTDLGYCFKLIVENAGSSRNRAYTNHYRMK